MSETTASDAPEEVEKVKPAQTEKGVCKHWAQKGFCFYGADNECKFLHPVKEAPRVAAIRELESKGEDQTELLKAVKDVMTSADRGAAADVDAAPRITATRTDSRGQDPRLRVALRRARRTHRQGLRRMPRTVNGTGHTGPSEFCATSI